VRRTIACRSGGATCARQEGASPRRPDRTSAVSRSPRVHSCPVRRGRSSRSRTSRSTVVKSATFEAASSSTRGSGWAPSGPASPPGIAPPPRAARVALRGRGSRAGPLPRLPFDHATAHGWQPDVARVHGRESKRRAERDVRSQRQSQRVRSATPALVGSHQQCGAANRERLRATVVAYDKAKTRPVGRPAQKIKRLIGRGSPLGQAVCQASFEG